MRKSGNLIGLALLVLIVIGVQCLTSTCHKEFYLTQLIISAYYAVVVLGLCLVMGYAGQISLGHGGFFAIGGYTSAILTTIDLPRLAGSSLGPFLLKTKILMPRQDLYGASFTSLSPSIAFILALLLAGIIALAVGYPTLRLKGNYLAMGTLGFGLIIYRILLGGEITGGADGISNVPPWQIVPGIVVCETGSMRVRNYYIAWTVVVFVLAFVLNLVNSRPGRALRSIHGSELAANAMGINTAGYKLKAFVVSAVLAASAGSFYAHYYGSIGPAEASAMHSVRYVALVAAGGMANVWGVLTVSVILTFLSLRGYFGSYDDGVFGLILILIMTLAPSGPLKPMARGLVYVSRLPGRILSRGRRAAAPDAARTGGQP